MQKLIVIDGETGLRNEQATELALWRGLALVLFPGLALVVGVIVLLMPALPPITSLNGCYGSNSYPLIRVRPGLISVEQEGIRPIQMSVETGKEGYVINAVTGFSFRVDQNGRTQAYEDYRLGELIPVYITRNRPPSLGLISNGRLIKIPKIDCLTA